MKLELSRLIFEKSSNIKFHENPSSESRVVPCEQTKRQTDRRNEDNPCFNNSTKALKHLPVEGTCFEYQVTCVIRTGRFFYQYPDYRSCHGTFPQKQTFYAIDLPCPARR